jgi:signal transduction histidine kinase
VIRRLAPTLVLLVLGFAALSVGLAGLHRIFAQERDDARQELAARRRALEQYALEAFKHDLRTRLAAAAPALEVAAQDPLADDAGLYLQVQGEQRLPRALRAAAGPGSPAQKLFEALPFAAAPLDADDPFAERLSLLRIFDAALGKQDRAAIEGSFRALLAHRASFLIAAQKDVPAMLWLLERFVARSTPQPSLLRGLLRDGVQGEGLERQLLRRKDRFTAEDLTFLCGRVVALARQVSVPADDFAQRCAESAEAPLPPIERLDGPALAWDRWYLEPAAGGTIKGVAVDSAALLAGVQAEMRDRGLLAAGDSVSRAQLGANGSAGALLGGARVLPLASVSLSVDSPAWPAAEREISRRYLVKSGLVVACGLLALGIVLLAALGQHRKHRYLELRSDFVSTVSHELRTPLASVRVMAETLERRVAATPGARDYPARIIREVDSLGFLVENILSFNRLDKNRWVARKERVRLDDLAPALADAATCTQAKVSLSTQGLSGVILDGDRELLKMLLTNLVRNACKYNARDEVRIAITSERRGAGVVLRVADNGVGIPAAERDNVFKEFYRLRESASRAGGSGLGLAICRRIMEVHEGSIRVAASGPDGTTFELVFPTGAG